MNTDTNSLMAILLNTPDFFETCQRRKEAVKEDKQNLLKFADEFNHKYQNEINEGDKYRQRLLSEGKSKGLTEEEIFKGNSKYIPTVRTPILNFLYFMLRESSNLETKSPKEVMTECLKQYGYETTEEVENYIDGIAQNFEIEKKLDELGDTIDFENVVSKDNTKEVEDIGEFLYGNLTIKEFNTIKKLKSLSYSDNLNEATVAHTKFLELCKKYNLEPERIPCYKKL